MASTFNYLSGQHHLWLRVVLSTLAERGGFMWGPADPRALAASESGRALLSTMAQLINDMRHHKAVIWLELGPPHAVPAPPRGSAWTRVTLLNWLRDTQTHGPLPLLGPGF